MLKTDVRVQGVKEIDKVQVICCALYNWLLAIDGLDADWESQILPVSSNLDREFREIDYEDISPNLLKNTTSYELPPCNLLARAQKGMLTRTRNNILWTLMERCMMELFQIMQLGKYQNFDLAFSTANLSNTFIFCSNKTRSGSQPRGMHILSYIRRTNGLMMWSHFSGHEGMIMIINLLVIIFF